jgi:AraC family transcriptional activator of tynA and feaB
MTALEVEMETIFSTTKIHPRDRFDYWHSVACQYIVNHDSKPKNPTAFHAELQSGVVDDIGLVEFETSELTVWHTARHVARADCENIFVCRQLTGQLAIEQCGRQAMLQPGDFTMLDSRLPYSATFSPSCRLLCVKLPRAPLEARLGKPLEMIARTIRPAAAESGLTSAYLGMLPTYAIGLSREAKAIVRNQVLDLVAVSMAKAMESHAPRVSSARSVAHIRVRAAIEAHLNDPTLDPNAVAAAAGISVRYANSVLADDNTSISRLIQQRRVARCRRALDDPSQFHRTVTEIAYGWGFSDMTHFARRFRAEYGLLPSEHRKVMQISRRPPSRTNSED